MAIRILVIEDDLDILEVLEYVLQDEGYEVVSSAHSAILTDTETIKPDLILLDEWLNEGHKGSDLCRMLKSNPGTAAIPVIILSAITPIELVSKQAGADGFIKKPFDIEELSLKVKQALQKTL